MQQPFPAGTGSQQSSIFFWHRPISNGTHFPLPVLSSSGPACSFLLIWRPPALPHRLQCSTIGRLGLNRRVRDGNGCVPQTHRHQKFRVTQVSARIFPEVRRKLASVRAYGISRICDAVATEELSFRGQHLRLITQQ